MTSTHHARDRPKASASLKTAPHYQHIINNNRKDVIT